MGLTLREAQELAVDSEMYVRNHSIRVPSDGEVGAFMDDWRDDRVNVWLDTEDRVVRAEIF